jgi:NADH-quinone oxidoreductase subunit H
LAYFAYANLSTLFMFFIVVGTRSKYATLSAGRLIIVSLLMDVFFMLCFLLLYIHVGGYSFEAIASANADGWLLFSLPPLAFFFLLYALFEAKRAPFDHTEAESELVAGHLVEFGGRSLLFFYLCEYAHAYFCMYLIIVVCLGGPEPLALSQFLPYWAQAQVTFPII